MTKIPKITCPCGRPTCSSAKAINQDGADKPSNKCADINAVPTESKSTKAVNSARKARETPASEDELILGEPSLVEVEYGTGAINYDVSTMGNPISSLQNFIVYDEESGALKLIPVNPSNLYIFKCKKRYHTCRYPPVGNWLGATLKSRTNLQQMRAKKTLNELNLGSYPNKFVMTDPDGDGILEFFKIKIPDLK